MTRDEIAARRDAMMETAIRTAKTLLCEKRVDQLVPIVLIAYRDGESEVIGFPFANDIEKQAALAELRRRMRERGAVAYAFVTEAWVSSIPKPEAYKGMSAREIERRSAGRMFRPSEDPNRGECVIVNGIAPGFKPKVRYFDIVRDWKGKVRDLTPKFDEHEGDDFTGTFMRLLDPPEGFH